MKHDSPANAWYRKHGYGYVAFEDGYDWLEKNLEYMNPNKQEWSEEDEEKLKAICTYLRDYSRLAKLGDKLRFNEYCDFLKSPRPVSKESLQSHWKPSEEQMKQLIKAMNTWPDSRVCAGLKSLCNDLQKLLKKL